MALRMLFIHLSRAMSILGSYSWCLGVLLLILFNIKPLPTVEAELIPSQKQLESSTSGQYRVLKLLVIHISLLLRRVL